MRRVTRAPDPHRVVERAIGGMLEVHAEPLDPAPAAVEERDRGAVHRLDQRHVRDPVVDLPVAGAIVGVVEERQVAGLGRDHLAAGLLQRPGAVPGGRQVDGEPGLAIGLEHVAGAVEPAAPAEQGAGGVDDAAPQLGPVPVLPGRVHGGLRGGWRRRLHCVGLGRLRTVGGGRCSRLRRRRGFVRGGWLQGGKCGRAAPGQRSGEEQDRAGAKRMSGHLRAGSSGSEPVNIPESRAPAQRPDRVIRPYRCRPLPVTDSIQAGSYSPQRRRTRSSSGRNRP